MAKKKLRKWPHQWLCESAERKAAKLPLLGTRQYALGTKDFTPLNDQCLVLSPYCLVLSFFFLFNKPFDLGNRFG